MATTGSGTGFGQIGIDDHANPSPVSDLEHQSAAGDINATLRLIERHLRRLDERYVEPIFEQPGAYIVPASTSVKIDLSSNVSNSIVFSVITGTANVWIGEYQGIPVGAVPNFCQLGAGTTQQFFFSPKGRIFTIQATAAADVKIAVTPLIVS